MEIDISFWQGAVEIYIKGEATDSPEKVAEAYLKVKELLEPTGKNEGASSAYWTTD